jgi:predicted transcriptional regulator
VVILDMKSGTYYGLNTVGTRVWELMQQPVTFSQIHETLLDEYDVDPEECRQDITTLLEDLINRGMVEVRDNSGA